MSIPIVVILIWWALSVIPLVKNINKRKASKSGYCYGFMDMGQVLPVVKIGLSSDKHSRLRSHKTAAPFGILTLFNIKVRDRAYTEQYLHTRYALCRLKTYGLLDNEWFLLLPTMVLDFIIIQLLLDFSFETLVRCVGMLLYYVMHVFLILVLTTTFIAVML